MDTEIVQFIKLVKEGLPNEHCSHIDVKSKEGVIYRVEVSEYECLYGNKVISTTYAYL